MDARKSLLLVGATSDIGYAVALRYAQAGWAIQLVARDPDAARRNRDDIAARTGALVELLTLDVARLDTLSGFVEALSPLPDTVVCAVGDLGEQARAEREPAHAAGIIAANFTGPALLLGCLAERFAARGSGTLVGIGSVAGDRGRGSNYVYGSAKAGFAAFLSGLRNRLAARGVHVLTVKPGFVRTRMTRGLKLPPLLTAQPAELGRAIFAAAEERRANVVYLRPIWRVVMGVIGAIPEPVFKRLKL